MDITGLTGVTEAQRTALLTLGAVDLAMSKTDVSPATLNHAGANSSWRHCELAKEGAKPLLISDSGGVSSAEGPRWWHLGGRI
jgi:hypothetical protein